jgi:hypothetical protein
MVWYHKEVDNPYKEGAKMCLWHTVDALFKSFTLGSAEKPRITSSDEIVGFDTLKKNDQEVSCLFLKQHIPLFQHFYVLPFSTVSFFDSFLFFNISILIRFFF